MFIAPKKLLVVSDNNEMEYSITFTNNKSKERSCVYNHTKSETKLGEMISFTEKELSGYLSNNIFKEI